MSRTILNQTLMFFIIAFISCNDVNNIESSKQLSIFSEKKIGQIEVGGPFVGIEIHNSYPMLNRISFYYPVANSIDISKDYWKRQSYRIMSAGIKIDDSLSVILPEEIYDIKQTPYSVSFKKEKYNSEFNISYEFCKSMPAFAITYKLTNNSESSRKYEFYTRMNAELRTSHTYKKINNAVTDYVERLNTLTIDYKSEETGNAILFVSNDGLLPSNFTTKTHDNINLDSAWLSRGFNLSNELISAEKGETPIVAYTYERLLKPNEEMKIIQIVGMLTNQNVNREIQNILTNYKSDILEYEKYVQEKSLNEQIIKTGDQIIDFTTQWSQAVLTTNAHYIDGEIVPMPAQAEYNFYFTHDALLTDLAAVNFDIARVKNDLEFIIKHADEENVIPHAYYWKDSEYKTEYCGTENWNHFWFTIVASRYLKHSNDYKFSKKIYPFVKKSIDTALKNRGDDGLMWSIRPDWWDIGNNYGPRAYMTLLAARAIEEFCYFSTILDQNIDDIDKYSKIAEDLKDNLKNRLWNPDLKYLTSFYEDGSEDKHIYMGSMLASHFDLLDETYSRELMNTAKQNLLDEKIGVYTLYPMDLHLLTDYMGFHGNEAGAPYYYANGGIWPHGNAWYALGLINNGDNEEAFNFIKTVMTIDGINNSPNGQPALYEYRISDKENPEVYGKIDKPQFLWAGGWYIYTLYNLLGVRENEWNISIIPYLPNGINKSELSIVLKGNLTKVNISGIGKQVSKFEIDGKVIPSTIVPNDFAKIKHITIVLGELTYPQLVKANAIVENISYVEGEKNLNFDLKTVPDTNIEFQIISPDPCTKIIVNGDLELKSFKQSELDGIYKIILSENFQMKVNQFNVFFNQRMEN